MILILTLTFRANAVIRRLARRASALPSGLMGRMRTLATREQTVEYFENELSGQHAHT